MEMFLKSAAGILIALIFCAILAKQGKDISLLLTVSVCCMITVATVHYLKPVIDFIHKLKSIGQLDDDMLAIILKITGIAMIGEITGLVCDDAGNAALGKTLQTLTAAVVLWMSVPLFDSLLELVQEILVSI